MLSILEVVWNHDDGGGELCRTLNPTRQLAPKRQRVDHVDVRKTCRASRRRSRVLYLSVHQPLPSSTRPVSTIKEKYPYL